MTTNTAVGGAAPAEAEPSTADDSQGWHPVQLSVSDYATRAVYDHGHSLANRRVVITGFITVAGRDTPVLTRMVLMRMRYPVQSGRGAAGAENASKSVVSRNAGNR